MGERFTDVVVMARPEPGAVELVRRAVPKPAPGEALVEIHAAGICGTDLHIVNWNRWAASTYRPPIALGHEFCGTVLDVGQYILDVQHRLPDVQPGDVVVAETHLACGACRQCRAGRRHICERLQVFSRLDRGAFTRLTVVPTALLRKVPPGVPAWKAALSEPLGIGVRAAMTADLRAACVLVSGCGPIGLLTVKAAKTLGAASVIATDIVPERLSLARLMGADIAFDPFHEPMPFWNGETAADIAIETSGDRQAIGFALANVASGGKLILAGLPDGAIRIDLTRHVVLREVSLHGLYGRLIDETWLQVERLIADPAFDLQPLVTHRFALADYQAAFATARSGRCGKVQFEM